MSEPSPVWVKRERWKPVVAWEGFYEVSDRGNVRRMPGKRLLKLGENQGYHVVSLSRPKSHPKPFGVHVLVARAFIGPPPSQEYEVGHKDGSKSNNVPMNLEWITHARNSLDGKGNPHSRMTHGQLPVAPSPIVVGLDPSTRYHALVCLADEPAPRVVDTVVLGAQRKGVRAEDRLIPIFLDLLDWLRLKRPKAVWCEDVVFTGGSRSLTQMAQAIGSVRIACYLADVPCYMMPVGLWKKEVVAKGNADKAQIKEFLTSHFGLPLDWKPPDLYDAYAIAVAGLRRLRLDVK